MLPSVQYCKDMQRRRCRFISVRKAFKVNKKHTQISQELLTRQQSLFISDSSLTKNVFGLDPESSTYMETGETENCSNNL